MAAGLSYVIEECLRSSSYPSQWKMSKVKAVPKEGNSSERGDFRPISLLNIPSKVYKGFIGEATDCHFIDGGLSSQIWQVNRTFDATFDRSMETRAT